MDFKRLKSEATGAIDAALTMVNRLPQTDYNASMSIDASSNPLSFAVQILRSVNGSDAVIKYIAYFVASVLPAVEVAVKGLLLSNIRNLLTCSFNPVLTHDLLKDGVVVPVANIDLLGTLQYSPLETSPQVDIDPEMEEEEFVQTTKRNSGFSFNPDATMPLNWTPFTTNNGKYYYFGCEQMKTLDELENAGDFNAWLWWVMNRSCKRAAWRGVKPIQATFGDSAWKRETYVTQRIPKPENYAQNDADYLTKWRDDKEAGILTLDFQKNPTSLRNAEGDPLKVRVPFNNALQVLIGNCEPRSERVIDASESVSRINNELDKLNEESTKLTVKKQHKEYSVEQMKYKLSDGNAQLTQEQIDSIKKKIEKAESDISSYEESIKKLEDESKGKYKELKDAELDVKNALGEDDAYQKITHNYYYTPSPSELINQSQGLQDAWTELTGVRTLVEFNYDYIMSLKLFDSKVVVAQLIDALSGCLSMDLGLSFEERVVREEIEKTVRAVIESDDAVISDCFFKFDNEEYNRMLAKAELEHAGFFAPDGNAAGPSSVSPEVLLNTINAINGSASLSEVETVIEGSLREVTGKIYSSSEKRESDLDFNFDISNRLVSELAYVLVSTFMSPKVYLLFAVNLAILGQSTDVTMKDFVANYRNLITQVIRSIRDILLEEMMKKIRELLDMLGITQAKLFAQEQYDYYKRLIKRCIDCFNRRNQILDFNVDNVNYADIRNIEEEIDSPRNEC